MLQTAHLCRKIAICKIIPVRIDRFTHIKHTIIAETQLGSEIIKKCVKKKEVKKLRRGERHRENVV